MELELQLKQLIIDSLALEDIGVEDNVDTDAPLFGDGGLGLDSGGCVRAGIGSPKNVWFTIG